ncbi:Hypothetical predicted protein [Pelobates cultripes]|uniref:Uncharacterized protein n=1 Tax=Pelobates cultripes TaxID=61616 RepID=A0AAD1RMK5_PELCU|nr:Hypothetical predicted protein [Pelobates cultripes]
MVQRWTATRLSECKQTLVPKHNNLSTNDGTLQSPARTILKNQPTTQSDRRTTEDIPTYKTKSPKGIGN